MRRRGEIIRRRYGKNEKEIICVSVLLVVLSSIGCIGGSIESYKPKQLPEGVYEVSMKVWEKEEFPLISKALAEEYNIVREMKVKYSTYKSIPGNWIFLTVTECKTKKDAERFIKVGGAVEKEFRDGRFVIRVSRGHRVLEDEATAIFDQVKGE